MRKDKIRYQYQLEVGDKVMFRDNLEFITMEYLGVREAYGIWEFVGEELKTNFYGTFHWNASQKYYFYKPTGEDYDV